MAAPMAGRSGTGAASVGSAGLSPFALWQNVLDVERARGSMP